ncbi:MAG: thioredoxin family protein [Marinicellaceae bacterium]
MALLYTPALEIGRNMPDFNLLGVDGKSWDMNQCMGQNGLVVMFICNHCPYVKSIQSKLVEDALLMKDFGINVVAIMSNDVNDYPEDSFENMRKIAEKFHYPFPYLLDATQQIAKSYGAVCTPDIFGLDNSGTLQYRGRIDSAGSKKTNEKLTRDMVNAMKELVDLGQITTEQIPSMGCSIKWIESD